MNRLVRGTARQVDALTAKLAGGTLGGNDFVDRLSSVLENRHTRAAVLGRQRAGDLHPPELDDARFAEHVMDREVPFLKKFQQDIEAGRYVREDGALDTEAINKRARMYIGRVQGTAQETFVLASDVQALFTWVLGGTEQHCGRCPEIAGGGPYLYHELPTHPRRNETPCLFRCDCNLRRNDGVTAFSAVEF